VSIDEKEFGKKIGAALANAGKSTMRVNLVPFTGGLIPFVYAFFWPDSFGHWLSTIVHAFRTAAAL
jgi:hypothetical protein